MMQTWIWTLAWTVLSTLNLVEGPHGNVNTFSDDASIYFSNQRDSTALLALYNATGGPFWNNQWNLDDPIEQWYGIKTNANGFVTEIDLSNNNLFGTLPEEIKFLSDLRVLKLGFNDLRGNLPSSIGTMLKLEEIFLFQNQLDTAIPDTIVNLGKLRILSLASNNIPGSIPSRIGKLSNLEMLVLDGNEITGSIPQSIGQLSKLVFLDLHNNNISGSVPSTLGNINNLRELLLYDNQLTGEIPNSVSNIDSLKFFWAQNNALSGRLPDFTNPVLRSIRMERNQIDELPDMTALALGTGFPDGLSMEYNKISFDDILLNFSLSATARFTYTPQDSLDAPKVLYANKGDRLEVRLPFDDDLLDSRYKWYKDDNLYQLTDKNVMIITVVDDTDAGIYYTAVTNPQVNNLTLFTEYFEIVVRDSAQCDVPPAGTSCVNAPLYCHTSDFDLYCGTLQPAFDTVSCQEISITSETRWLGFTTDSTIPTIRILPYSCSSQDAGIQVAVFRKCQGKELVHCTPGCTRDDVEIVLNNAMPNEAYYVAIRSCGGSCKYQIRAFSTGQPIALTLNGPLAGAEMICGPLSSIRYSLPNAPSAARRFEWYYNDDTTTTLTPQIDINWGSTGTKQLCVRAISDCGQSNTICKNVDVFPALELVDVVTDVVRNDSFYIIRFEVSGGVGPIVVDGTSGVYNALDKTFVSDLIPCGVRYHIEVTDNNGCQRILDGVEVCNCTSDAGEMLSSQVSTCADRIATVGPAIGTNLDTNDVGAFVITPSSVFNRLSIMATSVDGRFNIQSGNFDFDSTYYSYHIVGNDNGGGEPDLTDPCLSSSNPREIIFYSEPKANAGLDTFHCERVFQLRATKSRPQSTGLWIQLAGPSVALIDNDRSALTSVTAGAEGIYTFIWTETFNSCSAKDTIEVLIRPTVEGAVVGPDSLCTGETATLLLDRPFASYLWDGGKTTPSIQITGPGEYCVRVFTDDNCTRRFCKKIENSMVERPTIMGKNTICKGEKETLQVIPNYKSYEWSTGETKFFIEVDSGGLYCITVTDYNDCQATDCLVMNVADDRINNISETICYGESVEVFGESYSETGQYNLNFDDGGFCDSIVNLNLTVHPEIYISDSLVIRDDGTNSGAVSVNIKGGKPPYDYLWSNGATIPFVNGLPGGIYTLTVTDDNDCTQEFVFDLRQPNAVSDLILLDIQLIPNPAQSGESWWIHAKNVTSLDLPISFKIFTTDGQEKDNGIINFDYMSNSGFIPIPQTLEGVYLLYITDVEGKAKWFKVVVLP